MLTDPLTIGSQNENIGMLVRRQFPSADRVGECVVFDIHGNRCRLVAKVYFGLGLIRVVSLLTHAEYDRGAWKHACGC
jgi:mRNA interferase HigB